MDGMTRRDAVQRVVALMGGLALAGGEQLEAFSFDAAAFDQAMAQGVGAFTAADVALLDEIAETILPETTTPGAKAAKTGAFMALMVTDAYTDANQQVFRDGLRALDEACRAATSVSFMQATPAQRLDAARGPRPRAEDGDGGTDESGAHSRYPARAARRGRAAPLLPADEGAGAARLLHLRDRLHQGDALRRIAGALRSERAARARRSFVGAARLTSVRRKR